MKVGVIGASGRMGQAVLGVLAEQELACGAAIVSPGSAKLGQPAHAGLNYSDGSELRAGQLDVLIDFSLPQALAHNLMLAQRIGAALVVCTTGLSEQQQNAVQQAAAAIPLLQAANTSVGVCLLEQLVSIASGALSEADIEITEAHHSAKRDGPSGTALALGKAAAQGRQQDFAAVNAGLRGDGLREAQSIGFSVIRAADIVGEHTVMLVQPGERIELTHRVTDRRVFARGAVQAAKWLAQQPAGLYQMRDMLNMQGLLRQLLNEI
ncbi:4-hydroxy-tetrahydrodipicolinate reductase [Pseudidiomarina insulisalsae]|uniref:4-hydroxy-tetrahydrodipicolinate reductase n=1 Tax=Pseudidiomarina insulisalsae TaxID=575789 RepID=A0A432YEP4_9GAMM|nr:4-hydroxy-tetrahydrodipicolinate reductase [Pseudidiomarina insulisalsae]RUO59418.1 4-hydroxy-tetrahydrodipicolinate reductase [Pseudidiomarina insulisalsae]